MSPDRRSPFGAELPHPAKTVDTPGLVAPDNLEAVDCLESCLMSRFLLACLAGFVMVGTVTAEELVSPAEYLASLQPPAFSKTHTLPPLTRYGWTLPYEARVELARNWGYALELGGYLTEKTVAKLDDPASIESRLILLAHDDPKTFKLSVICSRRLPFEEAPIEAWTRDADGRMLDAEAQSLDGTQWQQGMRLVWSPEAPDEVWKTAGLFRADPIRAVREKCPIAIVLNGGEYGLGVLGFAQKVWEQDPRIVRAKGNLSWYEYISARKARAEMIIADEVKAAVPDRELYIYYTTTGGTHRNRHGDWRQWMYGYQWMKPVSDLASSEHYYMHFNSGWTGKDDLLAQALNARGFEIENGSPLCYDWLCAGWPRQKGLGSDRVLEDRGLGDLVRYTGFLKCLYHEPPHWIEQMIVLSRVHAFFSHLEDYIRNGELLPGPNKHVWSKEQPAYEFPTGGADVRVLIRRRKGRAAWLVAAWAAGGETRSVKVTIPNAGEVSLKARPGGSVYLVRESGGKMTAQLMDPDAMNPSLSLPTS